MAEATEQDFFDLMQSLKESGNRPYEWVMITGQRGYDGFQLAMNNMYMPHSVPYTYVNFGRKGNLWYLSVGKKHGNLKVLLNTRDKSYRIFNGTKEIFVTYDYDVLTKQIKFEYEHGKQ